MFDWGDIADDIAKAVGTVSKTVEQRTYGGSSIGESALSSTGAGGHFRFPDVAAARKIINDYEDRLRSIDKRKERIDHARAALGLDISQDPETDGFVKDARQSLDSLERLNFSMREYASNYIKKIETAIKAMKDIDDNSADAFRGKGRD